MSVIKVNKDNFNSEVINSDKPVLLDFYADWCGPCKMMGRVIDEIARENEEIKVCKVNVEEEQELAARFSVMSIPTLAVMKEGKLISSSVGAKPKAQIMAML